MIEAAATEEEKDLFAEYITEMKLKVLMEFHDKYHDYKYHDYKKDELKRMRDDGFKFKVDFFVHSESGGVGESYTQHLKTRPTDKQIRAMIENLGSCILDDYIVQQI